MTGTIWIVIWAGAIGGVFAWLWRGGHLARFAAYVQQTREELRILIVHHLPIHQDAYPLEARYCTLQELQLLAAQVIHRDRETRRVSSRSRQARHEALLHGIVAGGHDDGDGTRRRLCRAYALRRARDNDVDGEADEPRVVHALATTLAVTRSQLGVSLRLRSTVPRILVKSHTHWQTRAIFISF